MMISRGGSSSSRQDNELTWAERDRSSLAVSSLLLDRLARRQDSRSRTTRLCSSVEAVQPLGELAGSAEDCHS